MYTLVIKKKLSLLLGAAFVTLLTLSLVFYPQDGVAAAEQGLKIFWEVVLPSLLPFFVLSEIILGLGVVHFLGVLLEPLMRPLFNVPGVGAFALSMGLAAGYPMDAVITGKFRRGGLCTRIEGERLLSFTNTADPLFIFGAVAVGMFGRPDLGVILGIAHYLSSFTVGIIYKFYGRKEEGLVINEPPTTNQGGLIKRAVQALFAARAEDGRPFGRLMGDAVKESMSTLLTIGGFIMVFAVLVKILTLSGFLNLITPGLEMILNFFGIKANLAPALFNGILEIDLGTMAASKAQAPLTDCLIIASWIIAWSGFCVHGQVASVIHDTDIRMKPYFIARLLHAFLAACYTGLLFNTFKPVLAEVTGKFVAAGRFDPLARIVFSGQQLLIIIAILLGCSLLIYLSKRFTLVYITKEPKK